MLTPQLRVVAHRGRRDRGTHAHLLQLLSRHVTHLQLGPVLVQQCSVGVLRSVPASAAEVGPVARQQQG